MSTVKRPSFKNKKNKKGPPVEQIRKQKMRDAFKEITKSPSEETRILSLFKILKILTKHPKELDKFCSLEEGPILWLGSIFLVNKKDEDYQLPNHSKSPFWDEGPTRRKSILEYHYLKEQRNIQRMKRQVIYQLSRNHHRARKLACFRSDPLPDLEHYSRVLFYYCELSDNILDSNEIKSFTEEHYSMCRDPKLKSEKRREEVLRLVPDPENYIIWFPISRRMKLVEISEGSTPQSTTRHSSAYWGFEKARRRSIKHQNELISHEDRLIQRRLLEMFPKNVQIYNNSFRIKTLKKRPLKQQRYSLHARRRQEAPNTFNESERYHSPDSSGVENFGGFDYDFDNSGGLRRKNQSKRSKKRFRKAKKKNFFTTQNQNSSHIGQAGDQLRGPWGASKPRKNVFWEQGKVRGPQSRLNSTKSKIKRIEEPPIQSRGKRFRIGSPKRQFRSQSEKINAKSKMEPRRGNPKEQRRTKVFDILNMKDKQGSMIEVMKRLDRRLNINPNLTKAPKNAGKVIQDVSFSAMVKSFKSN